MKHFNEFEHLIDYLISLPGISRKQAEQICTFLVNENENNIDQFIDSINKLRANIHLCEQCNNISNKLLCDICANSAREKNKLCIVTTSEDLRKIEETNSYYGLYFVLNDEINVKGKNKINKETIQKLIHYLNANKFNEIILATNWTANGEATAYFLKGLINEYLPNTKLYRLAVGLPINSALNYADCETLSHAIKNKTKY